MNSLKKFNKVFGIKATLEEEKKHFVNRVNQSAFSIIHDQTIPSEERVAIFRGVCYELGMDPNPLLSDANHMNYGYDTRIPSLRKLTHDDFSETLKVLVVLYERVKDLGLQGVSDVDLDVSIQAALAVATIDLGIRWKDGMFYPSGAKELDEKLINDNLEWLQNFPKAQELFRTALDHFSKSSVDSAARRDAITNAYSAIESLAQYMLNNKKNFDNNSDEFVNKLNLPKEYKNILYYYKQIAHEYSSRHSGSTCTHVEAEAFIYLSGLLMRLVSIG